jgi:hypothetical protein
MRPVLYRRLLGLLPRRLRDEHGAEMEAAFHDALSQAHARGRRAVLVTWLRAIRDIAAVSTTRRLRRSSALPSASTRRSLFMRSGDLKCALRSFYRQPLPSLLVAGMLALGRRGQRRRLQPGQRTVPEAVPISRRRPAGLRQREGAAPGSREHGHQLSRLRRVAIVGQDVRRHRAL